MEGSGLTERLLRRDRFVLIALIGVLFALTGLYTVLGAGMDMTALDMTAMRGMRDMPGRLQASVVGYPVRSTVPRRPRRDAAQARIRTSMGRRELTAAPST